MFLGVFLHIKIVFIFSMYHRMQKDCFVLFCSALFCFSVVSPGIVVIQQNVSIAGVVINLSCDGQREDAKQPRS